METVNKPNDQEPDKFEKLVKILAYYLRDYKLNRIYSKPLPETWRIGIGILNLKIDDTDTFNTFFEFIEWTKTDVQSKIDTCWDIFINLNQLESFFETIDKDSLVMDKLTRKFVQNKIVINQINFTDNEELKKPYSVGFNNQISGHQFDTMKELVDFLKEPGSMNVHWSVYVNTDKIVSPDELAVG